MKIQIELEIESCNKCPFCKKERVWTDDSWDNVSKWTCLKVDKVISGYIDPFDKVKIPDWCPFNKTDKNNENTIA